MSPLAFVFFAVGLVETAEVTRNIELNLRVIEAFERGPVVLDVSITNCGKKPLFIMGVPNHPSFVFAPASWNLERRRPRIHCARWGTMGFLKAGGTFTERYN